MDNLMFISKVETYAVFLTVESYGEQKEQDILPQSPHTNIDAWK